MIIAIADNEEKDAVCHSHEHKSIFSLCVTAVSAGGTLGGKTNIKIGLFFLFCFFSYDGDTSYGQQ